MANLLSLKRRIIAAQNVSKTTKAMQMIAASKLKRAQDAAFLSRPYSDRLIILLQSITARTEKRFHHPYMKTPKNTNKDILIILAPDKGLSGGLTSNLIREVYNCNQKRRETIYLTVGKKIETYVSRLDREIVGSFKFGTTLPNFDMVFPILAIIKDYFLNDKVKSVKILYSKFISVFLQKQEFLTLLPIQLPQDQQFAPYPPSLFEPSYKVLFPPLLNQYLEITIFQLLLEAYASEQGARMIAMQNATNNAIDITSELKLEYNKARQEKITNEILDISSTTFSYAYE